MAESYSFFNSKDHDRVYNAKHWADYFYPFFRSGVFNGNLQVVEDGGMRVRINDGYAWIDGYLYHLTGGLPLNLETASGNRNRIDNIVIRLDLTNRWVKAFIVQGEYYEGEATPPEKTVTTRVHELVIARINIPAGVTQITQDMIEDTRMNDDLCGWVVGTVQEIDFEQIYAQFTAYQKKKTAEVDAWQKAEETSLATWVTKFKQEKTAQLKKIIDDLADMKDDAETQFTEWFNENTGAWTDEFTEWFDTVKIQLGEEAAGNLQNEINSIKAVLREISESEIDEIVAGTYEGNEGGMEPDIYSRISDEEIDNIVNNAFQ